MSDLFFALSAWSSFMPGENSYHQLPPTTPLIASKGEVVDSEGTPAPVELVTLPALGPEWERSEMKQMTKSGRREIKNDERRAKWRAWNRGEIGLCGTKWFTKKFLVFFIFAWCIMSVSISHSVVVRRLYCCRNVSHRQHCHRTCYHHPSRTGHVVLRRCTLGRGHG